MEPHNGGESTSRMAALYQRRAGRYDSLVKLFPFLGADIDRYRRVAVEALDPHAGETVVDVGCGTGLNFPFILPLIGPAGHLVGVDLSDAMLERAKVRIGNTGQQNVTLVCAGAVDFQFPSEVDAIISTFAITLVPEYDAVIERGAAALKPGGRFVIADFKKPAGWPNWLVHLAARMLVEPFGGTVAMAETRHPWLSLERYVGPVRMRESYRGAVYVAAARKPL